MNTCNCSSPIDSPLTEVHVDGTEEEIDLLCLLCGESMIGDVLVDSDPYIGVDEEPETIRNPSSSDFPLFI